MQEHNFSVSFDARLTSFMQTGGLCHLCVWLVVFPISTSNTSQRAFFCFLRLWCPDILISGISSATSIDCLLLLRRAEENWSWCAVCGPFALGCCVHGDKHTRRREFHPRDLWREVSSAVNHLLMRVLMPLRVPPSAFDANQGRWSGCNFGCWSSGVSN